VDIAVKLNAAEKIRRAIEADPKLTEDQVRQRLGVTTGQIKAALQYRSGPRLRSE